MCVCVWEYLYCVIPSAITLKKYGLKIPCVTCRTKKYPKSDFKVFRCTENLQHFI